MSCPTNGLRNNHPLSMSRELKGSFKPETETCNQAQSDSGYCKEVIYYSQATGKVGIDLVHMSPPMNCLQMSARTEHHEKVKQA